MKPFPSAAVLAAVLSLAGAASGQGAAPSADAIRRAAEAFDQGRDAYKSEHYAEAAEHFEAANGHAPSNKALEFAVRSRRRAGQLDRAATLAELALQQYPTDEKLKELTDEILAETAEDLFRVTVSCDHPCTLVVGSTLVYGAPMRERVLYLQPGEHKVGASWKGYESKSETVVAEPGEEGDVEFTRPSKDEPTGSAGGGVDFDADDDSFDDDYYDQYDEDDTARDQGPQDKSGGVPPAVFYVGAATTVVLAGVSTWSYIDTVNNPGKEKVEADCVGLGEDCPTWKEAKQKELRTNILLGATGVVGVATLVIAAVTDWGGSVEAEDQSDESSGIRVRPWVGIGQGATVGAIGRF
jgi:hypothetical protein